MKIKIRSQFIAPKGFTFIALDLSQAETWVVAHLANEPRMKDALKHSDIHTITAAAIFKPHNANCPHTWVKIDGGSRFCNVCSTTISDTERYLGKRSNHGNSYRMSAQQWTRVINSDSDKPPYVTVTEAEAKRYRQTWLNFYPGIVSWWRQIEYDLNANSRKLTTPYGRERIFYENWGDSLFKEATAHVPQSTVADHAFGCVQRELGIEGGILGISRLEDVRTYGRIVNTSHDSVMLEVPTNSVNDIAPQVYAQFRRPMVVNGETFTIPVDCEYGDRWGEMQSLKVA